MNTINTGKRTQMKYFRFIESSIFFAVIPISEKDRERMKEKNTCHVDGQQLTTKKNALTFMEKMLIV